VQGPKEILCAKSTGLMSIAKFINWCDKVMAFSFYALIYFLPISIALSEIFTVLALIAFLLKRSAFFYRNLQEKSSGGNSFSLWGKIKCFLISFKPVKNCLNWPITFLLFFNFISVLVSPDRSVSMNGFLGKVLQSAFLYFNFIECINTKKRLKIFLGVFLVSFTLICINGLYQSYVGHGFIHGHAFAGRITSSWRSANDFGAYLLVVAPVLFCLSFLTSSKIKGEEQGDSNFAFLSSIKVRGLFLILFILGIICLGLTYSRGAWVAFVLSLLFLGFTNRKVFLCFILVIITFLMVFYPKLQDNRASMNDKQSFGDNNNRLRYWKRATDVIKDYPYFGCGLNSYALVEGRYSDNWGFGGYPHNSYLQMTAEIGFIGLGNGNRQKIDQGIKRKRHDLVTPIYKFCDAH